MFDKYTFRGGNGRVQLTAALYRQKKYIHTTNFKRPSGRKYWRRAAINSEGSLKRNIVSEDYVQIFFCKENYQSIINIPEPPRRRSRHALEYERKMELKKMEEEYDPYDWI